MTIKHFLLVTFLASAASAQDLINQIDWARLAPKATETVEVNLDSNLLGLAMRFLSDAKPEEANAKKLIRSVKSVSVRSMKFAKEGDYSMVEVDKVRSQFSGPNWSKVVEVKGSSAAGSRQENVGVYMKFNGQNVEGIVVLAAEPRELTVVSVAGAITPEQLRALGEAGIIPKVGNIIPRKEKK